MFAEGLLAPEGKIHPLFRHWPDLLDIFIITTNILLPKTYRYMAVANFGYSFIFLHLKNNYLGVQSFTLSLPEEGYCRYLSCTLNIPEEDYCRYLSCTLNWISTCLMFLFVICFVSNSVIMLQFVTKYFLLFFILYSVFGYWPLQLVIIKTAVRNKFPLKYKYIKNYNLYFKIKNHFFILVYSI